jgi:hypothetical protein
MNFFAHRVRGSSLPAGALGDHAHVVRRDRARLRILSRWLDESLHAEKEFRARLLLQSARTLAAHPEIEWGDPLLHQRVSSASSYEIILRARRACAIAINQLA